MELQVCNNYEKSDTTICDKQYNFIIIILTIIYSTFISIIIFIKQPIIKEVIIEVPVEVIKEVIKEIPVQVINKVVIEENNEEELLLTNYNTKERALALQAAYKEQIQVLFEKRKNITIKLYTFSKNRNINKGDDTYLISLCGGNYNEDKITESLTVNDILLNTILEKMYQSIINDMVAVDKEILIVVKKAGLFEITDDLLKYLQKYMKTNPIYDDCKNVLLNM
jgi:hypothetical protein